MSIVIQDYRLWFRSALTISWRFTSMSKESIDGQESISKSDVIDKESIVEFLNLHFENLVPGIVSLYLLYCCAPSFLDSKLLDPKYPAIITGIVLIAIAYLIGVVAVTASRLVLDTASKLFFRWLLLFLFIHRIFGATFVRGANSEYRKGIKLALSEKNQSNVIKNEIIKRRGRTRLIRSALAPSIIWASSDCSSGHCSNWCTNSYWIILTFLFFCVLYAYAEVTIYEECLLATNYDPPNA